MSWGAHKLAMHQLNVAYSDALHVCIYTLGVSYTSLLRDAGIPHAVQRYIDQVHNIDEVTETILDRDTVTRALAAELCGATKLELLSVQVDDSIRFLFRQQGAESTRYAWTATIRNAWANIMFFHDMNAYAKAYDEGREE